MKAKATTTPKKAAVSGQLAGAAGVSTPKSKVSKTQGAKPQAPKVVADSMPDVKQPVDYSEALDLQVPSVEDVEAEILDGLAAHEQGPGLEFSEDVVLRYHALDDQLSSGPAARSEFLAQLSHLRLDRLTLHSLSLSSLRAMPALTHVYLQHNRIASMASLAVLLNLKFAALSHNLIETVEGVSQLPRLMFLDLSFNRLSSLDAQALPGSLRFLQLEGNPCTSTAAGRASVKASVLDCIPLLRHLDRPLDGDGTEEEEEGEEEGRDTAGREDGGRGGQEEGEEDGLMGEMGDELGALRLGDGALNSPGATRKEGVAGGLHAWREYDEEGGRLLNTALDMLDDLERACMDASASVVRESLRSSREKAAALRVSADARLGALPALRPGSAAARPRPGSAAAAGATAAPAPGTAGSNGSGGGGADSGGAAVASSSSPARQPSATQRTASPAPPLGAQRSGSGRMQLDPPLVTAGYAAADRNLAGTGSPSQLSRNPSLQGRASQLNPVRAPSPNGPRPAAALDSFPLASAAVTSTLGGPRRAASPLPPTPGAVTGRFGSAGSRSERVEAQISADLAMLRNRLQGLVEPMAAAASVAAAAAAAEIGSSSRAPATTAGASGRPGSSSSSVGHGTGSRPGSATAAATAAAVSGKAGGGAGSRAGGREKGVRDASAPPSATAKRSSSSSSSRGGSAAAVAAVAAAGDAPLVSNEAVMDASRAGLHAEMDRLMGHAATRVRAQRESDAHLSSDIRALRTSTNMVSQLKGDLSLRAAMSAGPGAVAAVRAAIAREMNGPGRDANGPGVIASALSRHAASTGAGGAGGDAGVAHIRASLQHLQQLSSALMAEHGAAVEAAIGVVTSAGLEDASAAVGGRGAVVGGQPGSGGGVSAGSKYQAMLAARLAARAALDDVDEEEEGEEEEGEGGKVGGGGGRGSRWAEEEEDEEDEEEEGQEGESVQLGGLFKGPALPPNPFGER